MSYFQKMADQFLTLISTTAELAPNSIKLSDWLLTTLLSTHNIITEGVVIDGDNPDHVSWLLQQAEQRAEQYNITGVTYRLTQGVVKRIIPAVASSNAVIAG